MPLSPRERKARMVLKGVSQSEIARELGVTQSHVSEVIRGHRRSPRVEEAIARAIELPAEDVFPPLAETAVA